MHHILGKVNAFKNLYLGKVWLFDGICSPLLMSASECPWPHGAMLMTALELS